MHTQTCILPYTHRQSYAMSLSSCFGHFFYLRNPVSTFLRTGAALLLTCFCLTFLPATALSAEEIEEAGPVFTKKQLEKMVENVIDTSVKQDQIPALYNPRYMLVPDASLSMDDQEVVFVAQMGGNTRIYPQRILVWHEAVNEEINGRYYSVTYSPLTGAVAGYVGRAGTTRTIFGITGKLLNANTVLFDRSSGSLWPQITGIAIEGAFKGKRLERFPVLWTTWGNARKVYPNAQVLSRSTGYKRSYGKDPYGSYMRKGTYYDSPSITYPVMNRDNRLPPKKRIIGIEFNSVRGVLVKKRIQREKAYNFNFSVTPMVAFWDNELETVRIYERIVNGKTLDFTSSGPQLLDIATRSVWSPSGRCLTGVLRGSALTPVIGVDMMWFAWSAFYPASQIYPPE